MNFLKKESGEMARKNLERAIRTFGDPRGTDKPRPYAKHPPSTSDTYWVGECPKCSGRMHAAYYTQAGIRYMCKSCGYKEGTF